MNDIVNINKNKQINLTTENDQEKGFDVRSLFVNQEPFTLSMVGKMQENVFIGLVSIISTQKTETSPIINVESIKKEGEPIQELRITISAAGAERLKLLGFKALLKSEKNKLFSEVAKFFGSQNRSPESQIFSGKPFAYSGKIDKQYKDLKQKLLDTSFLNDDPVRKNNFIIAIEEVIKMMLGLEKVKPLELGNAKMTQIGNIAKLVNPGEKQIG